MGERVEERGGRLGVAEHARPLAECEIDGDEDRGALVQPADEVEEKLPAGLGERQSRVHRGSRSRYGSDSLRCALAARLGLEPVEW